MVHSFILDIKDSCLDDYFTDEDKKTILEVGNNDLPELDESIYEIFENHASSVEEIVGSEEEGADEKILDKLWDSVTSCGYYDRKKRI